MSGAVVGVGEILWDLFPSGPRFGGAPANFACHAAALGCRAHVLGAVGDDELGQAAIDALRSHGVGTSYVATDPERPTGTVAVATDAAGVARYEFAADAAWDRMAWQDDFGALASQADAVCFGTLGQRDPRSRKTIRRFVAATPRSCLRVFDINLRPPFFDAAVVLESLELANVLKLSDDELPTLASMLGLSGTEAELLGRIAEQFGLRFVALTRGPRGASLFHDGRIHERAAPRVNIIDTVGAGDAFAAALVAGLLRRNDPGAVLERAVEVASFVCTRPGATPELPAGLRAAYLD